MIENLVIVESPAKAKTIEKFLGKDFTVKSSFGHIRDLSKKNLGIEVEKDYRPEYVISDDKKKVVDELRKLVKESQTVWLASDEDREGEAIAWHLCEVLKLDPQKTKRIVFHEITKDAIQNAIKNPRSIDINLVNSQQARRILDRLVGFELSPILWKKVKPALSAGRVQSVAVRLLVEREREIVAFKSTSFFKVNGLFRGDADIKAELSDKLPNAKEALGFVEKCQSASFTVADVSKKPSKKTPAPPFTTSTLQQEASRKLNFSVSQTMTIAQRLYEAGHITYMRTDSVNLSATAIDAARNTIIGEFGEKYHQPRQYKTKTKGPRKPTRPSAPPTSTSTRYRATRRSSGSTS
jgi:DNA topoisomerase-1